MGKITKFVGSHKLLFLAVFLIFAGGGYYWYSSSSQTASEVNYSTTAVTKGLLVSTVSSTGQVSASSQVDLQPEVSSTLLSLKVTPGQQVEKNELIAQLDSRDAARNVADARASLEAAQLDYQELLVGSDALTLLQAENSLAAAKEDLETLKITQVEDYQQALDAIDQSDEDLNKYFEDAYGDISDTFLDLPDIMAGIYDVLYGNDIADSEPSTSNSANRDALLAGVLSKDDTDRSRVEKFLAAAETSYSKAKKSYDTTFDLYKDISRYSDDTEIEKVLDQTIEITKVVGDAIKDQINLLDFWTEYRTEEDLKVYTAVGTYRSDLSSYTSKVNSHISTLSSVGRSIDSSRQDKIDAQTSLDNMKRDQPLAIIQAERTLSEKEQKLTDLKNGATELEIKNKQISIQQKQNSLLDAQQTLADYSVRAPFDGTIASVDVSVGDKVSSSTVIATLLTNQQIAEVTLNEVDATKLAVGQKATLTFDALEDLSISGTVAEVDLVGSVSQGVVSYNVKIAFDVADERVKPGMTVTANIIVDSRTDVILVPNSAVKSQNGSYYVQLLENGQPVNRSIEVGLSNDTMTEIVSGLEEGEEIITQTITANVQSATSTTSSGDRTGGPGGGDVGASLRFLR